MYRGTTGAEGGGGGGLERTSTGGGATMTLVGRTTAGRGVEVNGVTAFSGLASALNHFTGLPQRTGFTLPQNPGFFDGSEVSYSAAVAGRAMGWETAVGLEAVAGAAGDSAGGGVTTAAVAGEAGAGAAGAGPAGRTPSRAACNRGPSSTGTISGFTSGTGWADADGLTTGAAATRGDGDSTVGRGAGGVTAVGDGAEVLATEAVVGAGRPGSVAGRTGAAARTVALLIPTGAACGTAGGGVTRMLVVPTGRGSPPSS